MAFDVRSNNRPDTISKPSFPKSRPLFSPSQSHNSSFSPAPSSNTPRENSHPRAGQTEKHWQALEFNPTETHPRFYLTAAIILAAIVAYALYTNSPLMAITFILIGAVGYMYLEKPPRLIDCAITTEGVVAERELYLFENIRSFWIFDEPEGCFISLMTEAKLLPTVHIPLGQEDPIAIRELLRRRIPEVRQDPTLIDTLVRILHI